MKAVVKLSVAFTVGIFSTIVVMSLMGSFMEFLFPSPSGHDANDLAVTGAFLNKIPAVAFVLVLLGWSFAIMVGMWLASLIAGRYRRRFAFGCTGLVLLSAAATFWQEHYPLWFMIGTLLWLPLTAFASSLLIRRYFVFKRWGKS